MGRKIEERTKGKDIIYVRLLNEGVDVYRPVQAVAITSSIYEIKADDSYDPENEQWKFLPRSKVIVEEKILEKEKVLVATKSV